MASIFLFGLFSIIFILALVFSIFLTKWNSKDDKKFLVYSSVVISILIVVYVIFSTIVLPKYQFSVFKRTYEESLIDVLEDNSWELISVEYSKLVPDDYKDYFEIERVNEYDVFVYVKGEPLTEKDMYDAIIDIRCNNKYLLSNTYKLLSEGAYVDDDCKETGFHQVNTILVFDDNTEYQIDFRSLLRNNEVVYKQSGSSGGSSNVYPYGNECGYPECDHNRAEGKPYCHQHSCGESGCNNPTDLLPSYCDQHNCTYGSCSAPRYKAAGSTYCQRHYIENN